MILRTGLHGHNGPGVIPAASMGGGAAVLGPAGGWWDDFGDPAIAACVVGAYQGRAAANYAASLVNLANPGVNDLTEIGGGPPGWNAVQGWFNFLALLRCFDTGLVPAADQSWSALVQFGNLAAFNRVPFGQQEPGATGWFYINTRTGAGLINYANGFGGQNGTAWMVAGNVGVAGNLGYKNGVVDTIPLAVWGGATVRSFYVGARNNVGVAANHFDGDIWAVSFYNCTLTAPQMLAVAGNMAAL